MKRSYIDVPARNTVKGFNKLLYFCKGAFLSPAYWLLAHRFSMPGLRFHAECVRLGLFLLLRRNKASAMPYIYSLLFSPIDSTRYFEFDFVWQSLRRSTVKQYLDVSSPRIIPLLWMHRTPGVTAELINPDERDLSETAKYADALGLRQRCNLRNLLINKVPFNSESFDIITCVSVLEHIPESNFAIRKMWDLLRPGGKLIITLPCMAEATEQYISESEYGLLQRGQDGYTFWQLYYDQTLLEQKIFSIIGSPSKMSIYGERKPGSFARTAYQKRSGGVYPFWREPYMMGNEYSYFTTVNDLPGEGVVAMEFMKI